MKFSVKKNRNWKKVLIFFILAILAFFILNIFQSQVKNFFYLISFPIQKTFWWTGNKVSDFFDTISNFKNLKKENESLKLKIQELTSQNAYLLEIKKENESLRNALDIGLEKEFDLIIAQVIGKDISQDYLLINKGLKDGIFKDLPVITEQKILVGRISEVYENFSKIMLISNKNSSFSVKISDQEIFGIVKGKGNLKIILDMIPQEKKIKTEDILVTSALGGIFPSGILVGKIENIKKSDIEPFQQANVLPFFEFDKLNYLFVIINY